MPRDTHRSLYVLFDSSGRFQKLYISVARPPLMTAPTYTKPTALIVIDMITRKLRPFQSFSSVVPYICRRCLHKHVEAAKIPDPTPFVPDHTTFLTLIGRQLSKHATKFDSWKQLFTLSSLQLKEMGIEPARSRRYLLHWREKFRKGEFGIGGDLKYVKDGVGELRVVEVPALQKSESAQPEAQSSADTTFVSPTVSPGMTKLVVNVPAGETTYKLEEGQSTADLKKPKGIKLHRGRQIVGSYVQPQKGSNGSVAILKVQEGLWEHKRGHKVDGGERRKAEVRFKKRVEERKKERS
jgi:hypothetical protein